MVCYAFVILRHYPLRPTARRALSETVSGAGVQGWFSPGAEHEGTMTLTYIKSSDTLVGPGFFGRSEYERAK